MAEPVPQLSTIVLSPAGYGAVGRLMRHLLAQTVRERIELIVVTPSPADVLSHAGDLAAFCCWQVVEGDPARSTSTARVLGIRAARAPLVALTEEHCLPFPDWAEALLRAHDGGPGAVGPVVYNPNPRYGMSWAQLFLEYGLWVAPHTGGDVSILAGNNSCYRRDLLIELGDELEAMLEAETVLHWRLGRLGIQLKLDPAVRAWHINMTRWRPFLATAFHAGRRFAHRRGQPWPLARRLFYSLCSPAIPIIRLRRILADVSRAGRLSLLPRMMVPLAAALAASALGEAIGYFAGAGRSGEYLAQVELNRESLLARGDRIEIPEPAP